MPLHSFCIGGRKVWGRFVCLWGNIRDVPLLAAPFVYILPEWHPCVSLFQWLTWYIEKHLGFSWFAVDSQANGEQHLFLTFLNQAPVPNCIVSQVQMRPAALVCRFPVPNITSRKETRKRAESQKPRASTLVIFPSEQDGSYIFWHCLLAQLLIYVSFFALCIQHSPKCCGRL